MRKQTPCNQIGAGACRKGGSVGNGNSYEKQLSGTLGQICDSHGNVGQDHKGDDKFQKGTENTGGGNHGTADRLRQELTNQNTENNGNDQPWNKAQLFLFLFHKYKILLCIGMRRKRGLQQMLSQSRLCTAVWQEHD